MLILVWFIICIIFYFVQQLLGNSGHALEVFAVLRFVVLSRRAEYIEGFRWFISSLD